MWKLADEISRVSRFNGSASDYLSTVRIVCLDVGTYPVIRNQETDNDFTI